MNAYETKRAKQVSFYAVKGGWSVVFTLSNLTQKFVDAIHLQHRQPCEIIVIPNDPDSLFTQNNTGEIKKDRWSESQKLRMAVKRHWIALDSPGTWEDFYKKEMDGLTVYEDMQADKIKQAGEVVTSNNPSFSSENRCDTRTASPALLEV